MATVGCVTVFDESDNADAVTTSTGSVKVFFYDGFNYDSAVVPAYDAYQAVKAFDATHDSITIGDAVDNERTHYLSNQWGDYTEINGNYGALATVNGSSAFTIFVYQDNAWVPAQDAIGWYRPFADYAENCFFVDDAGEHIASAGAANIAIVIGNYAEIPGNPGATIGLTEVTQTADFRYTFHIFDSTATITDHPELVDGVDIVGYGSDANLALLQALGDLASSQDEIVKTNVSGVGNTYYSYYSWSEAIYGVGTQYGMIIDGVEYTYVYWESRDSEWNYLDFNLGHYSALNGALNNENEFYLVYYAS